MQHARETHRLTFVALESNVIHIVAFLGIHNAPDCSTDQL